MSSVSPFPVSTSTLQRVLGNEDLAKALTRDGPPIEVHVELSRSGTTTSGYQWTSTLSSIGSVLSAVAGPVFRGGTAAGPPVTMQSGTIAKAEIVTQQQAPIYLILAQFNR